MINLLATSGPFPIVLALTIGATACASALFVVRSRRRSTATDDAPDNVTGLKTRRRFDLDLDERARLGEQPTALLMIDVDEFVVLHDDHGPAVADTVLRKVGETISAHVRKNDVAYRYGVEEFSVLLPNTEPHTAAQVADRIRQAVSEADVPVRGRVTASVGVASGRAADVSTLIAKADAALADAKDAGCNRVAVR